MLCEWSCPLSNGSTILVFHVLFRLQTSTLFGEFHSWPLRAPLHLHLLLPRELQPLPEVHPVLLSGAHCVPSVGSQHLLPWVQCGVHHPQLDEVCELPVHCHRTPWQPDRKPRCRGIHCYAKWVTATDLRQCSDGASMLNCIERYSVTRHKNIWYLMVIIKVLSGLPSLCESLSSTCVSHFVCVHFLRSRFFYHHQRLHWSRQRPHQSDLYGSELWYYI